MIGNLLNYQTSSENSKRVKNTEKIQNTLEQIKTMQYFNRLINTSEVIWDFVLVCLHPDVDRFDVTDNRTTFSNRSKNVHFVSLQTY